MKVLHVDTRPDWRGGQSQVLLLLQGLCARGHRAELLVMEGTPLAERARAAGIVVHAQPARLWPLAGPRTIRRLIAASGFEIVHAHDPHGLTAAWLGRTFRTAALIGHRRIAAPLHGSPVALARYRAARRLIAVSRLVAEKLIGSGMNAERVAVVYDGVRVPDLVSAEARREARRAWAVPDDEVLLGYVAHLVPGKNHEALLRALPEMLARRPGCRLILAGDGPRRRELEEMSRALKIESRVIFAGFVGDVAQLYRALDVFLFPALGEGLGSSLLDAMAHGLPCVAAASGAVPEVIDNGRDGILLPAGANGEFEAGLVRTWAEWADFRDAERLGKAARARVEKSFSDSVMVEATLRVYESAL
jgi:glycosyltransferase involved in cell wall biosynthesis